jgi:pyruvate dehydrogenase E2 component (dihydrolipoamide acetyltransferase)
MLRRRFFPSFTAVMFSGGTRSVTIIPVKMPALSPTMESGKIAEWTAKIGDAIAPGDQYCMVQTDKAAVSFTNAANDGFLARVLVPEGDMATVGVPICLLVDDKADVNAPEVKAWAPAGAPAAAAATPSAAAPGPVASAAAASAVSATGGRVFASPIAKVAAKELGVDLSKVQGTGGAVGRVTKADVVAAHKSGTAAPATVAAPAPAPAAAPTPVATAAAVAPSAPTASAAYIDVPVTQMRRVIAKRLTQSKNIEVPHYYVTQDCRADNMMQTIKHLNAKGAGKFKISVNDFLIKAIARANTIVPACNSSWQGDFIRQYEGVDVSVAVAIPTGLITPIVKNAHIKGLAEISMEVKELAKKAKEGTLQPADFIGGTVSISNLGGSGIPNFTAIINPPQAMILAVGAVQPRPEIRKNEETQEYEMTGKVEQMITCTASFDHRVVDGAVGAEWFKHFKDTVENPLSLLL